MCHRPDMARVEAMARLDPLRDRQGSASMDAHAPGGETRPRLAVECGHRSLDAMQICESAGTWAISCCSFDGAEVSVSRARPCCAGPAHVVEALGESCGTRWRAGEPNPACPEKRS